MMSVMAMVMADLKNLNTEKILKMTILHDWAESKIGDFMPDEITIEKKSTKDLVSSVAAKIVPKITPNITNNP